MNRRNVVIGGYGETSLELGPGCIIAVGRGGRVALTLEAIQAITAIAEILEITHDRRLVAAIAEKIDTQRQAQQQA